MMKKILTALICTLLSVCALHAQLTLPEGYTLPDSLAYQPTAALDSTLYGQDVFRFLAAPSDRGSAQVSVLQSASVKQLVEEQIAANRSRKLSGYRIRIFFDNSQRARGASAAVEGGFRGRFPGVSTYRTYEDPFFKVLVGDFRDRSEAMEFLLKIKGSYPAACIVASPIEYPRVDLNHANHD